jgi:hypothetical protein
MALKKISGTRRQDRKARGHIPPLPHSSWRLAPAGPDIADIPIASASEFWSRLGL